MATLSATGVGSGLDIDGIITKLMTIESRPLTRLDTKEASYRAQLTAYGSIKGALATFQSAAETLATPAKFNAYKAASADATLFTATASSGASTGAHSVRVMQLAQAQKLRSATFTATTNALGSGSITIQFGTHSDGVFTANAQKAAKTIVIPVASSSLAGVRDAINAAQAGVTASIVNDGTGNRLVIGPNDTGVANALRIVVDDDDGNDTDDAGLSRLAYDASTGGTQRLTETVAALDANVVIDGITVTKSANVITDALEGVTLTLLKTSPSATPTPFTAERDTGAAKTAIEEFVKAYNELEKSFDQISAYDPKTKQSAILQGDATLRTLQSRLRGLLGSNLGDAGAALGALSEVGIRLARDGSLALDAAKLTAALADPAKDVGAMFAAVGKPTDSLVQFVRAAPSATPGTRALNVSQLATRGTAAGSVAAATTITAGINDALGLNVDGVAASLTLAPGSYSLAGLAAELQSKINGALGASGASVVVTAAAGQLKVTSNRYGSASTVSITGGSAATPLFGTPTPTAGADVQGTLAGQAGVGSGQSLAALGLTLNVIGGATGDRGAVKFARGFANQLVTALTDMLGSDGSLASRTAGIDRSIREIGRSRETLGRRLEAIEARYRAQFTSLDSMVASMNSTSSFLTRQLSSLAKLADSSGD